MGKHGRNHRKETPKLKMKCYLRLKRDINANALTDVNWNSKMVNKYLSVLSQQYLMFGNGQHSLSFDYNIICIYPTTQLATIWDIMNNVRSLNLSNVGVIFVFIESGFFPSLMFFS